jgi:hypothetical protein
VITLLLADAPDDRRVINLLVGAEACRLSDVLSDDWQAMLVALVGAPPKPTLPPTARIFCGPTLAAHTARVAGELLYERHALVSRVAELCNVKFSEFA